MDIGPKGISLCDGLVYTSADHRQRRPILTRTGLLLQGIDPIREIVRGLAIDRLGAAPPKSIIAETGTEAGTGDADQLIAHIPRIGVAINCGDIPIGVIVHHKAIKRFYPIGRIISGRGDRGRQVRTGKAAI